MDGEPPVRKQRSVYTTRYLVLSSFGLLFAVLVAYYPSLWIPFLSDDLNLRIFFRGESLDWARIQGELWSGWGGMTGADYYRPLLTYSIVVDSLFWGVNPFGYHLTNLLLHALNAILVGHIIMRLAGPGKRYPALLGALVFALHPIHPEAVSWIAGRVDVLSAFFFLLTIRCYLAYRWTGCGRHLVFSMVAMVLGLVSKESVAVTPLVLLALDVGLKLSRGTPRWAFGVRPASLLLFAVVAAYLGIRKLVLGSLSGGQDLFAPYETLDAIRITIKQTSIKLLLLLAPANEEVLGQPWTTFFQVGVIGMMILPFVALLTHGKRTIPGPLLGAALVLFPLGLVGHIHVAPHNLTNSRILYLPAAGILILLYSAPWEPRVRHELRRVGAAQMAVLSLLIITAFFVVLRMNLRPWKEAGKILLSLIQQVDRAEAATPPDKFLVLARLPDVHKGAYVCRNGFLFSLVKPFHHRDIKRVFPVLDHFYGLDPGQLRAVHGSSTRIMLWDPKLGKLIDLPPTGPAGHRLSDRDIRRWSRLDSEWWTPEPGLERRSQPDGGVRLVARNDGAGLRGPVMRISPDELHALRFRQEGDAQLAFLWSKAEDPDVFRSEPVKFFSRHQGWRTLSLINHDNWFYPGAPPVGRLRLSLHSTDEALVIHDFTLLRTLPRIPLAIVNEPLEPVPGQAFTIPLQACPFTHFKIVILNPAAPHAVFFSRDNRPEAPLVLSTGDLAHLHDVARALEGFEALVYIDALEADGNYLTTKARSRLVQMRFRGQ